MYRKLKVTIILLLLAVVVYLYMPSNYYIRKALIYQDVDIDDYKIFNNREINIGYYQPWKISNKFNKKDIPSKYLPIFLELQTVAYIVIKDTAILHEEYWYDYKPESLSNSFSIAKSIIGLLIGAAIDEGKIKSNEQPIHDFLPEFSTGENATLTIKHLLTMSSGLDWDEAYNSLFSQTTQAYYGNNLREQMMKLKVIEQPGKQFKYLSCNTQLLAFIIEKATGKTVSQYAAEKLWIPMGASKEALWSLDKENGDEKAYCCFNSTARDFARIGQLVLNKGNWNGQQLISEKYIIESTTPAKNLTDIDNKPIDSYGFHWWLMKYKEKDVIYARGILGQYIIIIPSENTVIVRLGHRRSKEKINNHPTDIYTWIKTAMELE